MEKLKNVTLNGIMIIATFIFNIFIFAPIEIFYTNINELWFNIGDILPIIIPTAIIITFILWLLLKLFKEKAKSIYITTLFIINLGLYIQGNFLNLGYNVLDGEIINWGSMISKGVINTLIWIVIILIPLIYRKIKKEESFRLLTTVISIFIILIQTITLTTVVITNNKEEQKIKGLNNNNIFNLSKDENIVVIMSDTFEATYMNKILEDYPEYKEKLKDFIYFDNCTGVSFYTYSSMPTLLTGEECKVGNSLSQNMKYCFENTKLYNILKENDYSTEIYTEKSLVPTNKEQIDNLNSTCSIQTTASTKIKIIEKLYKYIMYRYLPHFMKSSFSVTSDEFNNIKNEDMLLTYKEKTYSLDDVAFNEALVTGGITTNDSKKSFKFYETNGMHVPYDTTPEIKYERTKEYKEKDDEEKRYNEALASLNILCNYVDELKKSNIYNQTTIIFLADHGYHNRFYTNLIVKTKDANNEFKISSAPVSLKDDLIPTILNIATNSKEYGNDFFDYKEGQERIRIVYDYVYEENSAIMDKNRYTVFSRIAFQTDKEAKDEKSFYVVNEEYYNENKELTKKYEFNTLIKASQIEKSDCINLVGFNLQKMNTKVEIGWNISQNGQLEVNRKKTNSDVTIELALKEVYNDKQTVKFEIDGKEIYSCVVRKDKDRKIKFTIPKNMWNKSDKLKIKILFPDAKLGDKHAAMMTAIQIESIIFNN